MHEQLVKANMIEVRSTLGLTHIVNRVFEREKAVECNTKFLTQSK